MFASHLNGSPIALLNIVENFMNIAYLYLAHISLSSAAPLLGFASAVMTLSKTVLYLAQEYFCGGCSVGHNSLKTILVYWILPNGCVYFAYPVRRELTSLGSAYGSWFRV